MPERPDATKHDLIHLHTNPLKQNVFIVSVYSQGNQEERPLALHCTADTVQRQDSALVSLIPGPEFFITVQLCLMYGESRVVTVLVCLGLGVPGMLDFQFQSQVSTR